MSTSHLWHRAPQDLRGAGPAAPGDGQIVVNGKDVAEYFGGTGGRARCACRSG